MLGCCGAICDWAGRYEMYADTIAFLDRQLEALGNPRVIAGCPTCKKNLSKREHLQVQGVWKVLEEIGLPEKAKRLNKPIAVHDACGARGDAETQASIRRIAQSLGCQPLRWQGPSIRATPPSNRVHKSRYAARTVAGAMAVA